METMNTLKMTSKQRLAITFGIIAFLLLIPALAMQFTKEVDWNIFDFVVMGVLLSITGLAIEVITRKVTSTKWRLIITGLIILALLLTWAELAVGLFGTPFAGS
jgi:uncharacterized membrane protein